MLAVYELTAERARLRKVLAADELPVRQTVSLAFSPDSRFLAAATAPPEGHLACWLWEKQQLAATVRVQAAGDGPCQVMAAGPAASKTPKPQLCRRLCGSLLTLLLAAGWFFGSILHWWIKRSNFSSTSSRCEVGHRFILQEMCTVRFPVATWLLSTARGRECSIFNFMQFLQTFLTFAVGLPQQYDTRLKFCIDP